MTALLYTELTFVALEACVLTRNLFSLCADGEYEISCNQCVNSKKKTHL